MDALQGVAVELATLAAACSYYTLDRQGERVAVRKDKVFIAGFIAELGHILLPSHIVALACFVRHLPSSCLSLLLTLGRNATS